MLAAIKPYLYLALGIALLLAGLGLYFYGSHNGAAGVQSKWDASVATQDKAQQFRDVQGTATTTEIQTQVVHDLQVIKVKGDTITKEVTKYVSSIADSSCVVPNGFVRVHDAGVQGEPLDAALSSDGANSGLALSQVAGTVTANYAVCRADEVKLDALQEYICRKAVIDGNPQDPSWHCERFAPPAP